MTIHQQIVLERYPQAHAKYYGVGHPATHALVQDGHWSVYIGISLGDRPIGNGDTEAQAWAEAARRVGYCEA